MINIADFNDSSFVRPKCFVKLDRGNCEVDERLLFDRIDGEPNIGLSIVSFTSR